jgi:hypothetical protein
MKKAISLLLSLATVFGMSTLGACATTTGGNNNVVVDDKTINVRLYKAGYGDTFLYKFKEKFEEVYAAEGYKMNILNPTYDSMGPLMVQEMARGYDNTKIDLYITAGIKPNMVSNLGEYGEVAEDLTETVYNKSVIGYDKAEAAGTIKGMVEDTYLMPYVTADNGKMYGFCWAQASAGMVVNRTKLETYGYTELPRTTKEMFSMFDKIYETSSTTKTYPVTYNLSNLSGGASNYQDTAFHTWLAQFGVEEFNEFATMQTKNGSTRVDLEDGTEVFKNENIKTCLKAFAQLMDFKYAAYGSATQDLDQAQGLIMKSSAKGNNAVFMPNGDWFLNEIKANYSNLDDIDFMNFPVISDIGVKYFGVNTKYALNDDKCDELLSYICKLVDENKTISEMKSAVLAEKQIELDDSDIQAIASIRGLTYSRGGDHVAYVTKGSTKKDICSLVLRMMASEDYAKTFVEHSNVSTPYAKVRSQSNYKFVQSTNALTSNNYYDAVTFLVGGLRYDVMKTFDSFPEIDNLPLTAHNNVKSYDAFAESIYNDGITKITALWTEYKKN